MERTLSRKLIYRNVCRTRKFAEVTKKEEKAVEEQLKTVINKRRNLMVPMAQVIFIDGTGAGILS